ncbi:uncharacterized protein DS421_20g704430 [Arachis hypogaea]|nr:uncharacterized protein DS421_20g704430 [Arachis hypogaea]
MKHGHFPILSRPYVGHISNTTLIDTRPICDFSLHRRVWFCLLLLRSSSVSLVVVLRSFNVWFYLLLQHFSSASLVVWYSGFAFFFCVPLLRSSSAFLFWFCLLLRSSLLFSLQLFSLRPAAVGRCTAAGCWLLPHGVLDSWYIHDSSKV